MGTDVTYAIILAIPWIIFGVWSKTHSQVHDEQRDTTCDCSFQGTQLQGMPIGVRTWQETLGLSQVIFLAVYGVKDAWSGWVRHSSLNTGTE